MKVTVERKPEQFEAEQFLANELPWPNGVMRAGKDGFLFTVNVDISWCIHDTDWIVHLPGKTDIMSDKSFREFYDIVKNG